MKPKIVLQVSVGLLILFITAACKSNTATLIPTLTSPPVVQPTLTSLPPTITVLPPTPTTPPESWDLLILSNSANGQVGSYYAKFIEQALNVKVDLHDCWVSGLSIGGILENLQNDTYSKPEVEEESECYQSWPKLVKEAEVMVMFGSQEDAFPPDGEWNVPESYTPACVFGIFEDKKAMADLATYKERMLQSCDPATFKTYQNTLRSILSEIARIRNGEPLILRLTDFYIPVHASYRASGVDETCTTCMSNFSSAIRQVAIDCGVPDISTMNMLNGIDHMLDPQDNWYIGTDGGHLSDAGAEFVAKKLAEAGYETWQPVVCPAIP